MDIRSYNRIILVGNVTSEIRTNEAKDSAKVFARFEIATNEIFRDKKPRTQFHKVIAWGNRAEFCGKWLRKGGLIQVEGKLRYRYWVDPQGVKRRIAEIHVDQVVLLGRKEDYEVKEEEPTEEREPGIDDPL